jgi:hypothetical protein
METQSGAQKRLKSMKFEQTVFATKNSMAAENQKLIRLM